MDKTKVYVCVDAGGTSSKAALFTLDGNIIAKGFGKTGSPAVNINEWYLNIDKAIEEAITNTCVDIEIIKVAMGVSGISALNDTVKEQAYFENKYHAPCIITSDTNTSLYAILDKDETSGIIVISGTGVAVYGKNKDETRLIGGWGHIIRERGSAYSIVHDFCVNIIDKYEEMKEFNELEKSFIEEYNIKNIRDFNHLFYQHSKDEIASLSVFFKRKAQEGSSLAIELLEKEGEKLAKQVYDIMKILGLNNNTKVGLTGGFVGNNGEDIINGFKKYLNIHHIKLKYYDKKIEQLNGVFKFASLE